MTIKLDTPAIILTALLWLAIGACVYTYTYGVLEREALKTQIARLKENAVLRLIKEDCFGAYSVWSGVETFTKQAYIRGDCNETNKQSTKRIKARGKG